MTSKGMSWSRSIACRAARGRACPALPGAAVTVVQESGAVDADADVDAAAADELAPCIVHQGGVGLKGLRHLEPAGVVPFQQGGGLFVERRGQDHRLAGVPQEREGFADQAAGEDPVKAFSSVSSEIFRVLSVGEVAVGAVEVAERRRLDDEQLQRADLPAEIIV